MHSQDWHFVNTALTYGLDSVFRRLPSGPEKPLGLSKLCHVAGYNLPLTGMNSLGESLCIKREVLRWAVVSKK